MQSTSSRDRATIRPCARQQADGASVAGLGEWVRVALFTWGCRMSSSSRIAAATDHRPDASPTPADEVSDAPRLLAVSENTARLASPSADGWGDSRFHPFWRAALEAEQPGLPPFDLASIWRQLTAGSLRVWGERVLSSRVVLLACFTNAASPLCDCDAAIVGRVLCGDPQKVIASELGMAASTGSARFVRALEKLDLPSQRVPLAVILAAQSSWLASPTPPSTGRIFDDPSGTCLLVSVRRAATARMAPLTRAEQEIARAIIDGQSRLEIARSRKTSVHTVARQYHSIFETMKATGRFALIRSAIVAGAFDD